MIMHQQTLMHFIESAAEYHSATERWLEAIRQTHPCAAQRPLPQPEKRPGTWTDEDTIIHSGLCNYCLDREGSRTILQEELDIWRYRPDMVDYAIMLRLTREGSP